MVEVNLSFQAEGYPHACAGGQLQVWEEHSPCCNEEGAELGGELIQSSKMKGLLFPQPKSTPHPHLGDLSPRSARPRADR